MSRPIWNPGDGDLTVATTPQRDAFIYDRINEILKGYSIDDQASINAMLAYLGYSSGGASRGGDTFGFFSYGDSGAVGDVVINDTVCVPGYDIEHEPNITSLSFPNLVAIDPLNLQGGYFSVFANPSLTLLDVPKLSVVSGLVQVDQNPVLANVSFPLLATVLDRVLVTGSGIVTLDLPVLQFVGQNVTIILNPLLTSINLPNWVPVNGTTNDFSGDALSAISVELILRRLVLAGVTTCTINLSGGTNAGLASLSAQGQADAATLGAQLTINP